MTYSTLPVEEWREVPGHSDYEVSSFGRVRSWKNPNNPRILKGWIDPAGYHRVDVDGKHRYIHQIAAAAFIGPLPPGKEVDHINEIRGDNRATNLRYLTRQENLARRVHLRGTECFKGHKLEGDNLYVRPSSGRHECRTCHQERSQRRKLLCSTS